MAGAAGNAGAAEETAFCKTFVDVRSSPLRNQRETDDIWVMAETSVKEKTAVSRGDRWRARIAEQAVGRNNWVFFGSDEGGKMAAVLRSFTASCQRVKVDPFAWFKDVLTRIADHPITRLTELLLYNWVGHQA